MAVARVSVSHTVTPDSGPTAGSPGLTFSPGSLNVLRSPHVAYPQDKCVGLRSAFLFRCVIFSHVMSTLNTRARAPGSLQAPESGGNKVRGCLSIHTAPLPPQAWLIILLCRWDPRDPNTQAGSPATQPGPRLPLLLVRGLVLQAMHNVCSNQGVLWIPASPAGSPCPSGCCNRPSRWARITLGLLPEVGVLSLSTDPPSCCPCPSPLPHPTMRGQHPPHLGWGCPGRSPLCCEISSFGISVAAGVQLILHHVRVHAKYSTACHWCCPAVWEG